jgi:hypothetical protein
VTFEIRRGASNLVGDHLKPRICAVRRLFFILVLSGVIGHVASAAFTVVQAPGSGWMLVPTPERVIKTLYWHLFDETEVWTRIVPRAVTDSQKIPVSLIIYVTMKDRIPSPRGRMQGPKEVKMLAQPDPLAALPFRNLSFVLVTDTGERIDLIERGLAFRLIPPCDGCAANAIFARIDAEMFRRLAESSTVEADVLGFKCRLDRADTAALVEFARYTKLVD